MAPVIFGFGLAAIIALVFAVILGVLIGTGVSLISGWGLLPCIAGSSVIWFALISRPLWTGW